MTETRDFLVELGTEELPPKSLRTLELAFAAIVVAIVVGFPLGMVGGAFPGTWIDRVSRAVSFLGVAIPYFFLALVLVLIFSVRLQWLPAIDNG